MSAAVLTRRNTPKSKITARKSHDDPEVLLMLRARHGDAAAFQELTARYWSRVFAHFYRRFGDRQEAEDLTQEVFLRLYRYRQRYEPRVRFATLLFHITRNVARNAVRSRRRRPHPSPLSRTEEGDEGRFPGRAEAPSQPLERAEVARVVRAAVRGLAERQRTAMQLHQFEDRTYTQVAAAMAMTPKAAKSLLYRARNQLRAALATFMEA